MSVARAAMTLTVSSAVLTSRLLRFALQSPTDDSISYSSIPSVRPTLRTSSSVIVARLTVSTNMSIECPSTYCFLLLRVEALKIKVTKRAPS